MLSLVNPHLSQAPSICRKGKGGGIALSCPVLWPQHPTESTETALAMSLPNSIKILGTLWTMTKYKHQVCVAVLVTNYNRGWIMCIPCSSTQMIFHTICNLMPNYLFSTVSPFSTFGIQKVARQDRVALSCSIEYKYGLAVDGGSRTVRCCQSGRLHRIRSTEISEMHIGSAITVVLLSVVVCTAVVLVHAAREYGQSVSMAGFEGARPLLSALCKSPR